jgi:adenylate cyclase
VEIERKFLIGEVPDLGGRPSSRIEQGYLALADGEGGAEVRLRRRDGETLLTVKSAGATTRVEEEIELDDERFESLWPLTEGRRLSKRRFLLDDSAGTIELDVYEGELAGLVVAEVEFGDEAAADEFEPPAWFGEDVTADPSFRNATLATKGRSR